MYLAIRSDKPEAELYVLNDDGSVLKQKVWDAGRTLARDLPGEVDELMNNNYDQLKGVMVYKGPGSFTGLRIGITVANAIAYGKSVVAVGIMMAREYVNIENIFNMWIVSILSFCTYYLINWGLHRIAGALTHMCCNFLPGGCA